VGERVRKPHPTTWLNVGAWQERSVANGPGERFVLWLQGCGRRCPGCFNPEFQPFVRRERVTSEGVAGKVLRTEGIDGVSFTGGEPMMQARGLFELARMVRARGLSVFCYTGFTLEELQGSWNPWVLALLRQVDVLIDGPYEQDQAAALRWRGSRNQRVHFLTDRYRSLVGDAQKPLVEMEFIIGDSSLSMTGGLDEAFVARLQQILREDPR